MFSLLILHHLTVALCKADLSFLFTTIDIVLSSKKQREWLILLIDSVPLDYSPRARHPPLLQIRRDHTLPQPQHKKQTASKCLPFVCVGVTYLPGPSPAKYCQHK